MSKNIQTIRIDFRDGNGSGGNFGGGSSYQQEERKEAVQTTVPYNPPTFLGNKDMVQPYQSNLGTGSMFGSSGGGYVGVAEYNYITSNPHVGIGVHNWVPPELEQIQSIQTVTNITQSVVTNLTPPIVKTKPVETIKERDLRYAIGTAADVKAKAITEMIIATQEEGSQKTLNLEYMLNREDACTLGYALTKVSFDLDVMSLKNINLDQGIDYFLGIFRNNLNEGVFHNVTYLDLSNTTHGGRCLAYQVSHCLTSGGLKATKAINLSGNRLNDTQVKSQLVGALKNEKVTNLEYLNLSNNQITDEGASAIAEALESGKVNNLQTLDVSENNITEVGEGYLAGAIQGAKVRGGIIIVTHKVEWAETGPMAQFAKNIRGPFNETVDALIDGAKKQGTLAFGTKEAKQAIIGGWLESAQSKGVDTKNVVVSKDIFEAVINSGKLFGNFHLGWAKCSVVPKDVKSFAADKILAIASPEAGVIKTGIDIAFCYFESCDEAMSSQHGVQFLGDLGLLPQGEFIDAIE